MEIRKRNSISIVRTMIPLALLFAFASAFITAGSHTYREKGLKDYYKKYFPIGVAVTPQMLTGPDSQLIVTHFASLTAENVMKMGPIHPQENQYNWAPADAIVNFAQAHGLKMRGHCLCWHNQAPGWMFRDTAGKTVTKEVLLQRLKDHITTVVSRYKGKVYAWDVVNEAVDDNDSNFLRNSQWYRICGEDFIAKAFEYAHAADPDAILFYNDYNTERPGKRERIYKLMKKLLDAKVPVMAVGLQAHWHTNDPTEAELKESIEKFSSLGLKVQFTELDISIYPAEQGGRRTKRDDEGIFTPEREQKQLEQYKMVFKAFRDNRKKITGVTFWNLTDKRSWLDNQMGGRKNFPLLFDKDYQPKKAYWEVVKF